MSGVDTWRGIDFQAAYTVSLALDVLEGQHGEILHVDPGPDIVDYAVRDGAGTLRLVGQAKTRSLRAWPPGELSQILRRLGEVPGGENARLQFLTDGVLSPETTRAFAPAIERVARSQATSEDWQYLQRHGIARQDALLLARVELYSRYESAGAQLERAVRRVRALRDLAAPVSDDEAEQLVLRLHRAVTELGTRREGPSELARERIGAIVGVPPAMVDSAEAWSGELAERHRQLILAAAAPSHTVELSVTAVELVPAYAQRDVGDVRPQQVGPPDVSSSERSGRRALDLLDGDGAIVGPSGAGKSTTLRALERRAAAEGLTPVLLSPASYRAGELPTLVRRALSRTLATELGPGAGVALLARSDTVLLVDGAGEQTSVGMAQALARDIAELRDRLNAPTVILAARSVTTLRPFNLPPWRLEGLDRESRRAIAGQLVGDERLAGTICATLERDLHGTIENPHLFTTAVGLVLEERPPSTVSGIFAGFLQGLRATAPQTSDWELSMSCLGVACAEMIPIERLAQPRWDWLKSLERCLGELKARGLAGELTPAQVLDQMEQAGVLVESEGGLSLLHDSFRDWLAAQAVFRGLVELPSVITPAWSTTAEHLAELGSDPDMLRRFCEDPIVATHAASHELSENHENADEWASVAFERLAQHFAPQIQEELRGMRVFTAVHKKRTQVLLAPASTDGPVVAAAIVGADLPANAGPLSLAVALWLERLRASLRERPSLPAAPPVDRAALAAAIETQFMARREQLERLVACTVPDLSTAVLAHAGWSGMEGNVGASDDGPLDRHHPLMYGYRADGIRITTEDDTDHTAFTTRTSAEDWLRPSAHQAALRALRAALGDLLPGFGA